MIYAPITTSNPKNVEKPNIIQFSSTPSLSEVDNGMYAGFFEDNKNFPDPYTMTEWEDGKPMLNDQTEIYADIEEVMQYCMHPPLKPGEVYESNYRSEDYKTYIQNQEDWGERDEYENAIRQFTENKQKQHIIRNYNSNNSTSKLTFTFA